MCILGFCFSPWKPWPIFLTLFPNPTSGPSFFSTHLLSPSRCCSQLFQEPFFPRLHLPFAPLFFLLLSTTAFLQIPSAFPTNLSFYAFLNWILLSSDDFMHDVLFGSPFPVMWTPPHFSSEDRTRYRLQTLLVYSWGSCFMFAHK